MIKRYVDTFQIQRNALKPCNLTTPRSGKADEKFSRARTSFSPQHLLFLSPFFSHPDASCVRHSLPYNSTLLRGQFRNKYVKYIYFHLPILIKISSR